MARLASEAPSTRVLYRLELSFLRTAPRRVLGGCQKLLCQLITVLVAIMLTPIICGRQHGKTNSKKLLRTRSSGEAISYAKEVGRQKHYGLAVGGSGVAILSMCDVTGSCSLHLRLWRLRASKMSNPHSPDSRFCWLPSLPR